MARLEEIFGPLKGQKWQNVYNLLQTFSLNGLCPNPSESTRACPPLVATDATYDSNGPPVTANQAFYFHETHPLYDSFYPDSAVGVDEPPSSPYPDTDTDIACFSQQTDFDVPLPTLSITVPSSPAIVAIDEVPAPAPAPVPAPVPATPASKRKRKQDKDKTRPTALARSTSSTALAGSGKRARRAYRGY